VLLPLALAVSACSAGVTTSGPYAGPGPGAGAPPAQIATYGIRLLKEHRVRKFQRMLPYPLSWSESKIRDIVRVVSENRHWTLKNCKTFSTPQHKMSGCTFLGQGVRDCFSATLDVELLASDETTGWIVGWGSGGESSRSDGKQAVCDWNGDGSPG